MLESSVSKCEKTPWTRARRCLCFLMLSLMIGTFMLTFYISSLKVSFPLNFWTTRSSSSQSYHNITTSVQDISPDGPSIYFVAYPRQYGFIVDEPHTCWQERPFLVVMIPVAPHNREARDTIRSTWGKETTVLGRVIGRYFLLGMSKEEDGTATIQEQVLQESQRHHDILQSDFLDSYNNLTIKTMVMFEWLSSHCPNTSYAMKVDSDMFLNVHNLVDMLLKAPRHLYMTGMVARGAAVLRDPTSKWFLPVSVFPEFTYPPYALGLGYVFSLDLPKRILEASAHVKAVYIEDVYVGLCMRHLGIDLTDPPHGDLFRANVPYEPSNCYWTSVITTILQNSDQLSQVWGVYQSQHDC
ncbi:beta-1,3-galactosyltransferase 2-like [Anarrhichthys ocellatus]|uniref:beta-1,3-galactosyltransferase 2-like n=1 Tax=Anarrhichthys ocellatus TaxID=433405 RepID=UPI0012ED96C0|nr:beta-1,3-galactosyltransferase 2-like [Anarrhichthys ocellatus]